MVDSNQDPWNLCLIKDDPYDAIRTVYSGCPVLYLRLENKDISIVYDYTKI